MSGLAHSVWMMVRREWTEWRLLLVGAFLLGWLPWVAASLPAARHMDAAETRAATCLILATLFTGGAILLLGSSLQRDLASGTLSFYLARPLSSKAYWFGRCAGTLSLWLGCMGLVTAPTLLTGPDLSRSPSSLASVPLTAIGEAALIDRVTSMPTHLPWLMSAFLLVVLIAGLMLTVSWVTAAAQIRGPWLGLDVFGMALLAALLWTVHDDLVAAQAFGALLWLERLWILLWAPILCWAGLRQVELGRLDIGAGYALFSRHAWAGIGAVALIGLTFVGWILSGSSRDLARLESLSLSPSGEQLFVGGELRGRLGRYESFLLELDRDSAGADGAAYREIETGGYFPSAAAWRFSADGSRAIWGRCRRVVRTDCEIWTRDLAGGDPPRRTNIEVRSHQAELALSPNGRRVAVGKRDGIEVYDVVSGKLITAVRTDSVLTLAFADDQTLRSIHWPDTYEDRHSIRELDLTTKTSQVTGTLPDELYLRSFLLAGEHDILFRFGVAPRRYEIRDAANGELIVDLSRDLGLEDQLVTSVLALPDRRLAVLSHTYGEDVLDGWTSSPLDTARDFMVHIVDLSGLQAPAEASGRTEIAGQAEGSGSAGSGGGETEPLPSRRLLIPNALGARFGHGVEGGLITLLVRRAEPEAPSPWLETLSLEPMAEWSTWVLRPESETFELWAGGIVTPPVPPLFAMPGFPVGPSSVFLAADRNLFVVDGDTPRLLLGGLERPSGTDMLYLGQ